MFVVVTSGGSVCTAIQSTSIKGTPLMQNDIQFRFDATTDPDDQAIVQQHADVGRLNELPPREYVLTGPLSPHPGP